MQRLAGQFISKDMRTEFKDRIDDFSNYKERVWIKVNQVLMEFKNAAALLTDYGSSEKTLMQFLNTGSQFLKNNEGHPSEESKMLCINYITDHSMVLKTFTTTAAALQLICPDVFLQTQALLENSTKMIALLTNHMNETILSKQFEALEDKVKEIEIFKNHSTQTSILLYFILYILTYKKL